MSVDLWLNEAKASGREVRTSAEGRFVVPVSGDELRAAAVDLTFSAISG